MKPVPFKGQTATPGAPEGAEHYCGSMPVNQTPAGYTCCWEMTEEEYTELGKTRKIWASISSGNCVLMTWLGVEKPYFPENRSMYYLLRYVSDNGKHTIAVWIGCDSAPPNAFIYNGMDYTLIQDARDVIYSPYYEVTEGCLWVRDIPEEFHSQFGRKSWLCLREGEMDIFLTDVNF